MISVFAAHLCRRCHDSGHADCCVSGMSIKKQMKRHLGKKATRRIYAAMPWVGGVAALAAAAAFQKRGVRGTINAAPDIPSAVNDRIQRHTTSVSDRDRDGDLVGSR